MALTSPAVHSSTQHPLDPPDRSSPRATLTSFLESVDRAWELYSAGDTGFKEPFRDARECLDLSDVPPLVMREVSAERTLALKEVLDRIEMPAMSEVPDSADVEELGLVRWVVPRTEIQLVRVAEGDREGQWIFSNGTVRRAEEFYQRVRHLPYQAGRPGGHLKEMRGGTDAIVLLKLIDVMPSWFTSRLGAMMVWQWFGLGLLVVLLALPVGVFAWLNRRWHTGGLAGHTVTSFLVPLAMMSVPLVGHPMINRIFVLPGRPTLMVRLGLMIVGSIGLAWLLALVITRIGELTVKLGFRNARPLKQQLIRVIFRIATIVVVIWITVAALQTLGAPIAGLIAGLGVGGFAIALAAQGTLENFIGGIILYADQPVKVGDFCRFGGSRGMVEDVGLRSVKVRMLDRTVLTVPNADFAKLHLENLSERDQILLRENLCLQYETTRKQLRSVLSELESMLRAHPRLAEERLRVRFNGFGEYFLKIELVAYALTQVWPEFLEIREDILLKVMEIVERSGTRLALPTEVHYSPEPPELSGNEDR
jgi:MscS family membrane protein